MSFNATSLPTLGSAYANSSTDENINARHDMVDVNTGLSWAQIDKLMETIDVDEC